LAIFNADSLEQGERSALEAAAHLDGPLGKIAAMLEGPERPTS
jgi:hypothetical protein